MNASMHSEIAIETDRNRKQIRTRSADPVPVGDSFNEPKPSPSGVRSPALDDTTFACFLDGAGI
jgi:hypothetical protein